MNIFKGPERVEKLLIIPDAHAHPAYDNDRFDWLASLIAKEKPDVLACLGDAACMPSLSSYDRGKRGFEGRRYVKDVEVTRDAMGRVNAGTKGYSGPRKIMLLGNHEHRINKATSDNAEFEGTIGTEDLGYEELGWEVAPFEDVFVIGGFSFSHHFASGNGGRPIGGLGQAAAMARILHTSAVAGHSHILDTARRVRVDGTPIVCVSAGCYTHLDQGSESWCKGSSHMWWRGVVIMEGVAGGDAGDIRYVSMDRMKAEHAPTVEAATKKRPAARAGKLWKGAA